MLATPTIDPEDLYTIGAGGFSATADAFTRDDKTEGLWFVSMVGSQTALKAIWTSLLKQQPDASPTSSRARTGWPCREDTSGARFPTRPWGRGRPRSPG